MADTSSTPPAPDRSSSGNRAARRRRRVGLVVAAAGAATIGALLGPMQASAVNVAQSSIVSANPDDWTPQVMNGAVIAVVQVGNKLIAAGTFTTVRQSLNSADITRNRMFAIDLDTQKIDPDFNPNFGGAVNSLTTDGTNVYAGGAFSSVGGSTAIKRVVKLNGTTGAVDPTFKAVPNSGVNEVVYDDNGARLFVGGGFTAVKNGKVSSTRHAFAALSPTTGAVLGNVNVSFDGVYDPSTNNNGGKTNVKRFDVTPNGSKVVAIGNFSTVGGLNRSQVAVLDTPTGGNASVDPWATNRYDKDHNNCAGVFDSFTRDLDISPDGSYVVISATGAYAGGPVSGTMCDTTSRWELASRSNDPTWIDYTGGDTTYGVAVTGTAVYLGGHFRWENNPWASDSAGPGAVPRPGIAALDPVNGLPLDWNPTRDRGVGAQALYSTSDGLWVGSDTKKIGHEVHQRIAFLPLAGGHQQPTVDASSLPGDVFIAPRSGSALLRRPLGSNGAPTGSATTASTAMTWSTVRGAFLVNSTLYYGSTDGRLHAGSFDPSTGALGSQRQVNLYGLDTTSDTRARLAVANLTGMFYDTSLHRLYYTLSGDSRLFYRYFTPDSEVVGAQPFTASSGGVNFSTVNGMTLAGGRILYGSSSDGALRSVSFSGGAVTGSPTVVSSDGTWRASALFMRSQ